MAFPIGGGGFSWPAGPRGGGRRRPSSGARARLAEGRAIPIVALGCASGAVALHFAPAALADGPGGIRGAIRKRRALRAPDETAIEKYNRDELAQKLLRESKSAAMRSWVLFGGLTVAGSVAAEVLVRRVAMAGAGAGFAAVVLGSAAMQGGMLSRGGGGAVARSMGGREVTGEPRHPVTSMVADLAATAGIPMPQVYVIPSKGLNAFAAGLDPTRAAVAVTQGLLEALSPDEVRAVVGHEIGHIANGDCRSGTQIAAAVAGFATVSAMGWRLMSYNRMRRIYGGGGRRSRSSSSSRRDENGEMMQAVAMGLVAVGAVTYAAASLLKASMSREREYAADAAAAAFSDGEALARALEKIAAPTSRHRADLPQAASAFYSHLYISPQYSALGGRRRRGLGLGLLSTHPDTPRRVARLKEVMARLDE